MKAPINMTICRPERKAKPHYRLHVNIMNYIYKWPIIERPTGLRRNGHRLPVSIHGMGN